MDPKVLPKVIAALGLDAGASIDDVQAALDAFGAKMRQIEDLAKSEDAETEDPPAEGAPAPAPEATPMAAVQASLAKLAEITDRNGSD